MNPIITHGLLRGQIQVPASKTVAHRLLIAAALSDRPTDILLDQSNADIDATARCLNALGAHINRLENGFSVEPITRVGSEECILNCGESGSTLRFLLPICAALGANARLEGTGRLPERPNAPLTEAMCAHGIIASSDCVPIVLSGKLRGGAYSIAGNISSQYITGLLVALPVCDEDSVLTLSTPLESASYVDITLHVLKLFGIEIIPTSHGWRIPGGQRYHTPEQVTVEGDWSSAAFWLAANAMGNEIHCAGLIDESRQGDRKIRELLNNLGGTIEVSDTPDLVPALAIAASVHEGTTVIIGAERLRIKESDRLRAIFDMLTSLGGCCEERRDGLIISGKPILRGGKVEGYNDHRIVMAAAIAATRCEQPLIITDAHAVQKSYPTFWEQYALLGGNVHVEPHR